MALAVALVGLEAPVWVRLLLAQGGPKVTAAAVVDLEAKVEGPVVVEAEAARLEVLEERLAVAGAP